MKKRELCATEYYNTIDKLSSSSTLHAPHPWGSDDQARSFVVVVVVVRISLSSVTVIVGGIRVVDRSRNAS